jgi:hypothetical protein
METPQNDKSASAPHAVVAVRLVGVLVAALAFWQMVGNLIGSWRDFDPNYLGYYFASELARPLAGIATGALLWLFSGPIGRRAARAKARR